MPQMLTYMPQMYCCRQRKRTLFGCAVIVHHRAHQLIAHLHSRVQKESSTGFSFLHMSISSLPVMSRPAISN